MHCAWCESGTEVAIRIWRRDDEHDVKKLKSKKE